MLEKMERMLHLLLHPNEILLRYKAVEEMVQRHEVSITRHNDTLIKLDELRVLHEYTAPEYLCNNGIIDKPSYLESAREAVNPSASMDALYANIAKAFRADMVFIRKELERFLPYIREASHPELPFLDIGCGQGAFLDILAENQVKALGIDFNAESVKPAIEHGHKVIIGEASEYIEAQEDQSFRGMSLIMVSEHIMFQDMYRDIFMYNRKIAQGGLLIINTINPYCYKRMGHFRLDPSHVNFLLPEIYKLIMEMAGFRDIKIIWSAPIGDYGPKSEWFAQYENVSILGYKK